MLKIPDHTRTSPHATSLAINCPISLKAPVRSRYGLSQSLVVKSVGFGPTRALVVTGDREEVPTGGSDTSDDEENPSSVEQELDNRPGLTAVESWVESWADKRQPLPSNKLANQVAKKTVAQLTSNHASSTQPKDHIRGHTLNAENVPWKPDHTAFGYFRGKADPDIYCIQGIAHEEPTFQKIPTTSFDTSPPSSLLSEYFCRPSSRQPQQTPGRLSNSSLNLTTDAGLKPNHDNNEVGDHIYTPKKLEPKLLTDIMARNMTNPRSDHTLKTPLRQLLSSRRPTQGETLQENAICGDFTRP